MQRNNASKIGTLLGNSGISRLLAGAGVLAELDALVHELLPSPLKEHCRVLSVRDDTLVLAADSPVWSARLRFHAPKLVKQLGDARTVKLRTVQVRVRPVDAPAAATQGRRPQRALSERNSSAMAQTARGIRDPELRAALLRLAARRQR